jgi:uncharacterized RDD family membrane protein YckC
MTIPGSDAGPTPPLEGLQVLRSPEQVALHLPLAGPTSRILAYAIDLVLVVAIEIALLTTVLLGTPLAEQIGSSLSELGKNLDKPGPESSQALLVMLAALIVVQLVIEWGYFTFFELAMGGRSPGKRVMGLRVMRDGGLPLTLRESLVRNVLRCVDMLPSNYVLGLVSMIVSSEGKRLGDIAAGTVVVRIDRIPRPRELPEVEGGERGAFRFDHAQIARLGELEGRLLRQTLRRIEDLGEPAASQLLERAVEALRARLEYGPVAADERRAFLRALLYELRRR